MLLRALYYLCNNREEKKYTSNVNLEDYKSTVKADSIYEGTKIEREKKRLCEAILQLSLTYNGIDGIYLTVQREDDRGLLQNQHRLAKQRV